MDDDRGAGDIEEILHKCGMIDRFERQHWHRDSVSETYRSVVTCLDRLERQKQSRGGQTMSRLRIYNALSMSSGEMNPVEMPYLRLDRGSRTLIAKLRTGTLPLSIETGRYRQIALDQRLCRSCDRTVIVRRAGLLWSQQDFEWRWSVPLFKCLTVLVFSFILFDLCLLITFFNFIMNYVPIVTFWIFTYHKIWILSIMFCFIWSYWNIYFLTCLEVSWRVVS